MSERRIAVVTGAAAGIGAAVARTLARDGYSLALLDRDDVELKRVTAELAETIVEGADIESHVVDVTDRQAVDAAVASTMDTFGRIDALAHVAGILDTGSVLDSDPDQWGKIFGVNVFGLLNVLQSVGLEMRRRRAGAMVVVSSNAAGVPRIGMGAYGSSKAAATMLVRTAGLELAADGIRVNVVAPGSTDTAMQRSLWSDLPTIRVPTRSSKAIWRAIAGYSARKTGHRRRYRRLGALPAVRPGGPHHHAGAVRRRWSDAQSVRRIC